MNGAYISVSVDGTDCRIQEPSPFNKCWFSHKLKGTGVRYEIALSIETGEIVWAYGPFPRGSYPDIKICKSALAKTQEKAIADSGY